ncbi:MAG: tRNA (adenosine(37)-N6)-threonylcarbamoyltransferase complex ATPase subunit type 1 TsaE [Lentisphaeraceae bacterium]|nr:tRNA (adenosine(37)-N6)-threonylcarbamoyltransferase complex ATPase subunit type 1 TsaE [Lentisphaeraceae bacterium]
MKFVEKITNSEEETVELARALAQSITAPAIVTLTGDLGAGKTVFSRGFARALGVEGSISSPTFTIVQEYELSTGTLYHMDLYRISSDEEAISFGIEDFLNDPNAINLIEWPQRLEWLLPENIITVEMSHVSEFQRKIRYLQIEGMN